MARQFAWVIVAMFVAAATLTGNQPSQPPPQQPPRGGHEQKPSHEARQQDPNRFKWWINADSRKELGITDAQSAQINQIFESTMPTQRAGWRQVEEMEKAVSQLLKENIADVATVTQQVDRLEKLQAELRTNRVVMLYRIHLVLTPEQRVKLEAFRQRRDENRRKNQHR